MGDELREMIRKHSLIDKSFDNARERFDDEIGYNEDKALEHGISSVDSIKCELDGCSYNISDLGDDRARDCIEISIEYYFNDKLIGYCTMLYNVHNFELEDDHTVIDWQRCV